MSHINSKNRKSLLSVLLLFLFSAYPNLLFFLPVPLPTDIFRLLVKDNPLPNKTPLIYYRDKHKIIVHCVVNVLR
jgi:hypothetical protein